MFWRGLSMAGLILAGLGAVGCWNSEADFKALLEENNALTAELSEVRQENEILNRALEDIKREQEVLQLLLSTGKGNLNTGRLSLPPGVQYAGGSQAQGGDQGGNWEEEWQTPRPPATVGVPALPVPPVQVASPAAPVPSTPVPAAVQSGRIYVTKDGDVLSNIARANNTTVARLLELNPSLRNRRNYMIYTNERLRLP